MAEDTSDFELVPFKQIEDLRKELTKLKEVPLPAPKKLELSLEEVSLKLDKLIGIFEEAGHLMKVEDGGLKVGEQIKTLTIKLEQVVDQNKEIAQALVTVADMITEMKEKGGSSSMGGFSQPKGPPPLFPPGPAGMIPPPPLPPQRKGMFGR